MAINWKKLSALLCCCSVFLALPAQRAAGDDVPVVVSLAADSKNLPLGTGFRRGGDLWISEKAALAAGIPITSAPNGKGWILKVHDPAVVFENKEIERLAGKSLNLYFPSAVEEDVSYFNISGMERITRVAVESKNGVLLRPMTKSEQLPKKQPLPAEKKGKKIKAVWEHVPRWSPDIALEPVIDGLNAILPTWFNLIDEQGGVANRASAAYVDEAHKRGIRVWALVSNGFSRSTSTKFFESPRAVNLFIARMLAYAKLYNLDGINIDFENMAAEDSALFVRFISILAEQLKKQGLHVSVDVVIPGTSYASRSHDRAQLANYVDCIMLMAYDQHWRTSPVAGSVASMPWVERAVHGCLSEGVPAQKLVLGVPFYMRRWEETPVANGKVKVKSFTLTMPEAESNAARVGAKMTWLEDQGQHYFSYEENNKTYKVWVENAASIERKLTLVSKHDLAGVAAWRKGHEHPNVWRTINRMVN